MERSWYTRRVEGANTLFDRQLGIAEQSLLRVEDGVGFGDSVPHTGLRETSIVQTLAQCLHALHHSPSPTSTTVDDDLNNISGFVLRNGPATMVRLFSFHLMPKRSIALVLSSRIRVSDSLYLPSRTNHPPSTNDGAPPTLILHSVTRWTTTTLLGFAVVLGEHEANSLRFPATSRFL